MMAQRRLCFQRQVFRVLGLFAVFTIITWLWHPSSDRITSMWNAGDYTYSGGSKHPIERLTNDAQTAFDAVVAKRTTELHATAEAYRKRRGRHPPPGFDKWYKYAQEHDAFIVEDFFDQIYHDLNPFWGLPAKELRQQAKNLPVKIVVRNGTVTNPKGKIEWMNYWIEMLTEVQHLLPNLDMPVNLMDEPRIIVPWEEINTYVQAERETRKIVPVKDVVKNFSPLDTDQDPGQSPEPKFVDEPGLYWDIARVGCAPDSPSRSAIVAKNFSGPGPLICDEMPDDAFEKPKHCHPSHFGTIAYKGYVANWTAAKDSCLQPELRETHGSFVAPLSQSTIKKLIPHFGGSKLSMNNDILLPAPMYWPEDSIYATGGNVGQPWEKKSASIVWRGGATGGRVTEENWTRFQRHRFISVVNGTEVRLAEQKDPKNPIAPNFAIKPYAQYRGTSTQLMPLGDWLDQVSDCGFTNLICLPASPDAHCSYLDPFFKVATRVSLDDQYGHKYLPDIDGNSFSGRYLAFLRSTSLPIKATAYNEWHDSRIFPWIHFVPMQNSFVDAYGILDYYIGGKVGPKGEDGKVTLEGGRDEEAKKIALEGKKWAETVLRKEDMALYVLRLLLEYVRIGDDQREKLGFVDDLQ